MALATVSDLASWTGTAEADLPDDADRMLKRAGDVVRVAVVLPDVFDDAGEMLSDLDQHEKDALRDAACAQVEYWIAAGETVDIEGPIQGFTLGDLQVQYGAGDNRVSAGTMAPRARRLLLDAGLLSRGAMIK